MLLWPFIGYLVSLPVETVLPVPASKLVMRVFLTYDLHIRGLKFLIASCDGCLHGVQATDNPQSLATESELVVSCPARDLSGPRTAIVRPCEIVLLLTNLRKRWQSVFEGNGDICELRSQRSRSC